MAQNDKVVELNNPVKNPLNTLLKQATRDLLLKAVQVQSTTFVDEYASLKVIGKQTVVSKGY